MSRGSERSTKRAATTLSHTSEKVQMNAWIAMNNCSSTGGKESGKQGRGLAWQSVDGLAKDRWRRTRWKL